MIINYALKIQAICKLCLNPRVYAKHSTMFADQHTLRLGLVSPTKQAQGLIKFKFGTLPCSLRALRSSVVANFIDARSISSQTRGC